MGATKWMISLSVWKKIANIVKQKFESNLVKRHNTIYEEAKFNQSKQEVVDIHIYYVSLHLGRMWRRADKTNPTGDASPTRIYVA